MTTLMPIPIWMQKSAAVADSSILRPKGLQNCLMGVSFVRTGELKSMSEEQMKTYIQVYGGKLVGSVSGKTNYLVMGSDPGQTK